MADSHCRSDESWCVTQAKVESFSFTWTIKNYSFLNKGTGNVLKSSVFTSPTKNNTKWCIHIYPMGNNSECKDYISLYLQGILDGEKEILASFQVSLLDSKGDKTHILKQKVPREFTGVSTTWGWNKFIEIADLKREEMDLLQFDALTILCEIKLLVESCTTSTCGESSVIHVPECRLGNDLSLVFENELLSDVTLVASGKKFKVHRIILAARSPVFAAMFSVDMKEKNAEDIPLPDINPNILEDMLHFIYTAEVPKWTSIKQACELLAAADMYALDRLKLMCENYLYTKITIENVSELLALADLHNAAQLKRKATYFIQNNVVEVQQTPGWNSLFRKQQQPKVYNNNNNNTQQKEDFESDSGCHIM